MSSLFPRANGQSTLYAMAYGKGRVIEIPDSGWYLTVHSGKSSGLLYKGLRCLLGACVNNVLTDEESELHFLCELIRMSIFKIY